jgi:peptidoglycan/LPS O-acetylase OafA/YrhL
MSVEPPPPIGTPTAYRADLDGLRAVAIVPVVLYHFGVPFFGGGFVGVDVFFVISGYLITRIILAAHRDRTFSFARFYERRARRLLPTLATALLATFIVSLFVMTPQDLAAYCRSMFYALIFAANFYFADEGGYFTPTLELAPLLHTWSLAVEEQFYIVWPLLIGLLLRFLSRYAAAVAALLLVASFVVSADLVVVKPHAAFYLPHARAWELLAGCILALVTLPTPRRWTADAAGALGLALILFTVIAYDTATPFPGLAAIPPVLGAALVIWAGQAEPSLVNKLLSFRPLVGIGLVSYAWFIWHWPMLVLFRHEFERDPNGLEKVVLIAASLGLAVLCWRYLEQPVRHGAWWASRGRALSAAAAATLALLVLAGVGHASHGFIQRYPAAMQELTRKRLTVRAVDRLCPRQSAERIAARELCRIWDGAKGNRTVLLWGDSHAMVMRPVFRDMAEANQVSVVYSGVAACPPLIGTGRTRRNKAAEVCGALNLAIGDLLAERRFTDVVLAARWNYYAEGDGKPGDPPGPEQHYIEDAQSKVASLEENRAVIARNLRSTVDAIIASGARAWIVLEAPYVGFNVPNRLARAIMRGESPETMYGPDTSTIDARDAFMRSLLEGLPVRIIDPSQAFCDTSRCVAVAGGKPLYFDDNHLSVYGGARLEPLLGELFAPPGGTAKLPSH